MNSEYFWILITAALIDSKRLFSMDYLVRKGANANAGT